MAQYPLQASINSGTVMYGVFGDPVKHSKSPVMLNRAFQEAGVNAAYAAFHVAPGQLKAAIEGVRALNFRGINVTLPHKVEVMKHLDEIDPSARHVGAVNTIVNENGRLIGYNTDGLGYVRSLKEETGIALEGKKVLVLGAGGAARGITYALAREKPSVIWIANRTAGKAHDLAHSVSRDNNNCIGIGLEEIPGIVGQADLVVNTTLVGMFPNADELPMDPSLFHSGILVSDIVYNPLKTKWLILAEGRGSNIHSGLGMFIYQGAYAFEYWTGLRAPTAAMRDVVEQSFKG